MLYRTKSKRSIADSQRRLEEYAARHQFGILAVHNLRETMKKKGVEFDKDCWIYEVCNPAQAKRVLEANEQSRRHYPAASPSLAPKATTL